MNRRRTYQILTVIFLVAITSSLIIPVYSEVMISKQNEENTYVNLGSSALQSEFPFDLTRNEFKFTPSISYDISGIEMEPPETFINAKQPRAQSLMISLKNSYQFDPDLGTSQKIANPTSSAQFFRGDTVTVTGNPDQQVKTDTANSIVPQYLWVCWVKGQWTEPYSFF